MSYLLIMLRVAVRSESQTDKTSSLGQWTRRDTSAFRKMHTSLPEGPRRTLRPWPESVITQMRKGEWEARFSNFNRKWIYIYIYTHTQKTNKQKKIKLGLAERSSEVVWWIKWVKMAVKVQENHGWQVKSEENKNRSCKACWISALPF